MSRVLAAIAAWPTLGRAWALAVLVGACASASSAQLAELASLRGEARALDGAIAGAFAERARAALEASKTLGEYLATVDPWKATVDRAVVLVRAIEQAAHAAGIRIAKGDPGDHLATVRRLVCELGVLVRERGIAVFAPGERTMRCSP